jgi:cyanophycinase
MPISATGPLALVGSGEYTAAMRDTDALLLAASGTHHGGVALLPTASAREPGKPAEWNAKGVAHFAALGATTVPLLLLNRADADDRAIVEALRAARFLYFSGGDPQYLVETLRDTAAWDAIARAHNAGAALAGCSAGAMMLGEFVVGVRALRHGQPPHWEPALGLARGIAVLPHFDRLRLYMGDEVFAQVLAAAPPDVTPLGIDEDTALVRLPDEHGAWRVTGRQTVTVFAPGGARLVYRAGETVVLPAP